MQSNMQVIKWPPPRADVLCVLEGSSSTTNQTANLLCKRIELIRTGLSVLISSYINVIKHSNFEVQFRTPLPYRFVQCRADVRAVSGFDPLKKTMQVQLLARELPLLPDRTNMVNDAMNKGLPRCAFS